MLAPRPPTTTLDDLQPGDDAWVADVIPPAGQPDWGPWLTALGFEPGERLRLQSRARPGGDPLCVRVGVSTYALRRAEAACIRVHRAPEGAA